MRTPRPLNGITFSGGDLPLPSEEFAFENSPLGMDACSGAERLTFIDDRGGVLIVSSSRVMPAEPEGDLETGELLDAISSSVPRAAWRPASDREPVQISELHESPHRNLRCWTGEARTRDGSVTISQCVLASQRGVLLATLETPPPEQSHREVFQSFVKSVFSSDFRAAHSARSTHPADLHRKRGSDTDAEPDPPGPERPDGEQFATTFSLGCPCGSSADDGSWFSHQARFRDFDAGPACPPVLRVQQSDRDF